jgi:hypothetical protein
MATYKTENQATLVQRLTHLIFLVAAISAIAVLAQAAPRSASPDAPIGLAQASIANGQGPATIANGQGMSSIAAPTDQPQLPTSSIVRPTTGQPFPPSSSLNPQQPTEQPPALPSMADPANQLPTIGTPIIAPPAYRQAGANTYQQGVNTYQGTVNTYGGTNMGQGTSLPPPPPVYYQVNPFSTPIPSGTTSGTTSGANSTNSSDNDLGGQSGVTIDQINRDNSKGTQDQ